MKKQVTGGKDKWPVFDRNGKPIRVGDTVRAQICVGRYGQTRIVEAKVSDGHFPFCQMSVPGGIAGFRYSFEKNALIGYNNHVDFEHGHETWVEVVKGATK